MGFICVVKSEETDVLKLKEKIWPEALTYSDDTAKTKKLENGTQVVVTSRLIAIQMKDGKLADMITTPGGYLYHENAPANEGLEECAGYMQSVAEPFMRKTGMEATGFVIIETDRNISSPEDFREWLMQYVNMERDVEVEDVLRVCSNCGRTFSDCADIKFCTNCGKEL